MNLAEMNLEDQQRHVRLQLALLKELRYQVDRQGGNDATVYLDDVYRLLDVIVNEGATIVFIKEENGGSR